jgi:aryl-alcohol dehydrogenase-like predicted oxidoreductase
MMHDRLSRRDLLRTGALAAAGMAAGLTPTFTVAAGNPKGSDTSKILNYNPQMEYRRCGKTGLMVSAVAMGGHWKRINRFIGGEDNCGWTGNIDRPEFQKNRRDVVTRAIERGVNWIDACSTPEIQTYSRAIRDRRDRIYLACSWYEEEMRSPQCRSFEKLKAAIQKGLKEAALEYCDLWRISLLTDSSHHADAEMDECVKALEWAKKSGLARFTGVSSHDRPHLKKLIETYPQAMDIVVTPYTARTKVVADEDGLWASLKKHQVGWFGIKPFASNSIFKGDSSPTSPTREEDNRLARLAIRCILCNPAITAPIPGLVSQQQADNVALAVMERRELDLNEKAELDRAMDRAWANLPASYQWLKDWEYV